MCPDGDTLYVIDNDDNCVRVISISTRSVSSLTTCNRRDADPKQANFSDPSKSNSALSPEGRSPYVVDRGNYRICQCMIDFFNQMVTAVCKNGSSGTADGPGNKTMFIDLSAIAITADGSVIYLVGSDSMIRTTTTQPSTTTSAPSTTTVTFVVRTSTPAAAIPPPPPTPQTRALG